MKKMLFTLTILAAAFCAVSFSSCKKKDAKTDAGNALQQAGEAAGNAVQEAGEAAEQAAE